MKKCISIVLTFIFIFSIYIPAFAADQGVQLSVIEGDAEILATYVIPNDIADSMLPCDLANTVAMLSSTSTEALQPYGTSKPDKSNVWDLSSSKYNFYAETIQQDVYSNYVFTGHEGSVKIYIDERSGYTTGTIRFMMFIRNFWNTTVYDVAYPRGQVSTLYASNFDADDLVYFAIVPDGVYTYLYQTSYIAAY